MKAIGLDLLYQVNFPKSQAGKVTDVRYEIFNDDGTVFQAATNLGVVEFGHGKYGVILGFPAAGSWSIEWSIVGTSYFAGEEINIYDDTVLMEGHGI